MKKIVIALVIFFAILCAFIIRIMTRTDADDNIPQQKKMTAISLFDLDHYFQTHRVSPDSLPDRFPYDTYLDSANIKNIRAIKNDLRVLDSFSMDQDINRQTLSRALTVMLAPRYSHYLQTYEPDSLLVLVQWAEKFNSYADIDRDNDILYQSIYNYWLDTISNKLAFFSAEKPSRKYDFKFKYLRARCIEQRFVPAVKVTSEEKAVSNLVYGTWGHFARATWNQTSLLQKFALSVFIIITLYGYICILQRVFKINIKND